MPLIMEKPALPVGTVVGTETRWGVVLNHSKYMRDRATGRALVGVKLYKGRYPLAYFKDTELEIAKEQPLWESK